MPDHDLEELPREELVALVRDQQRQIEGLRGELERLQRRLNRNSSNSSMPPSGDDVLPGRGKPGKGQGKDKRKGGGGGGSSRRRRGKQNGAEGR